MTVRQKYNARMTVNLDLAKKEKLQAMAAERKLTDSDILRDAIDKYLKDPNGITQEI